MQLKEIIPLYDTLMTIKDKEMPLRISYKFSKLLLRITEEYDYYMNQLRKIFEKYGLKDENGAFIPDSEGNMQIQPEKVKEANKEIKELESIDVSNPPAIYFSVKELESLSFKPSELQGLMSFIEDDT